MCVIVGNLKNYIYDVIALQFCREAKWKKADFNYLGKKFGVTNVYIERLLLLTFKIKILQLHFNTYFGIKVHLGSQIMHLF